MTTTTCEFSPYIGTTESKDGGEQHLSIPAYESAATNYRLAHRKAIVGDSDFLAQSELLFIQSRCRHIIRNNPTASSIRDKHVQQLGNITVVWQTKDGKKHEIAQELWDEFAENPSIDGKGSLASFEATQNGDRFESGEAFARMLVVKDGKRIPLKLQGIESEYLDISYRGHEIQEIADRTFYGITFDKQTLLKPEFYNFFKNRYFSYVTNMSDVNAIQRVAVPAQDVLHTFERRRSGQWRGIPMLASCLIALYEIEDLCTATVRTQTAASTIAWIISEMNGTTLDPAGRLSTLGRNSANDPVKQIAFDSNGGSVQYTQGKFNLVQSRDIGSNLVDILKEEYEKISAAVGIPYYQLSGNTADLDFSTIRALLISLRQRLEFIYNMVMIPDFHKPLTTRFKDIALAMQFPIADALPTFQFPRWYGVDDLKDNQADLLEVISGFAPIQAMWAERGYNEEQISESLKTIKNLGLEGLLSKTPSPEQNNSFPTNNTTGS